MSEQTAKPKKNRLWLYIGLFVAAVVATMVVVAVLT